MLHRALLLGTAVAVFAAGGCKKGDDDAATSGTEAPAPGAPAQTDAELDAPLATIDDVTITVREFQERINRQSPYVRARYTSQEQKKEFLDNLIRFEVLAKEALRRGLDKDPDVVRTMKQVMIQKLMKDEFEDRVTPETISEEEMRAFFEANEGEYNKPEEVRVSAIVLPDQKTANKVAQLAKGEAGKSNKGFRELVSKHSVDEESKLRGGDLRYFARDTQEIPAPVVEAAFALERTGDVAGPIAGDGQFYIIKQIGRRKAVERDFEDVKRQIQNRLYRDKRNQAQRDFIDKLRAKSKIEIDEQNLAKVRIDTSQAQTGGGHGHGAPAFPGADPASAGDEVTE